MLPALTFLPLSLDNKKNSLVHNSIEFQWGEIMRKMKNKKILVTMNMPPLYHTIPGERFDIRKSECIQWLIRRPDILNYLWDQIKQSGYIVFDPQTGKWHGIDFRKEENE